MIRYRVIVSPEHRDLISRLPPSVKKKLHASLRLLEIDPAAGKPLERELTGYRSYPIHPYRVVYRVESSERVVRLVMVAPRREIYDLMLQRLPLIRDRGRRRGLYPRLFRSASLLR